MLLALDPGLNSPGVAVFALDKLIAVERFDTSEYAGLPDGQRWLKVAWVIAHWALAAPLAAAKPELLTIVFERPQVYTREKSKGDPNQLVGIAGVAANLTGILSVYGPVDVSSPHPGTWIGQVPKRCPTCDGKKTAKNDFGKRVKRTCPACQGSAWGTPRGRLIRSRLSEAEIALVPDQNDAIDAVGLGLWAVGGLAPRRVYSNGRDGR